MMTVRSSALSGCESRGAVTDVTAVVAVTSVLLATSTLWWWRDVEGNVTLGTT